MDRLEQAALIALLQTQPNGLTWADITADVLANGSALDVWHEHRPPALFDEPGRPDALTSAEASLRKWESSGLTVLTITDDRYPQRLRGIHQAPPLLFARGGLVEDDPAVSIVGSRAATNRGLRIAGDISRALVSRGLTVIAGLANGVDTSAHRAALDAGGRTVAVLGTGINRNYPSENHELQNEIGRRGLLLSQFWPDAPPQKHTFLMRNATMSGYGLATVVVEAGENSGTRVQARMAVEHGRTVILVGTVIDQNEWAKKLCGRPGVHRADDLQQVVELALHASTTRLDVEDEIERVASALK
ncbi:DNA processing protein [Prauserella marina]|uniref:DNA processing protein n=1 Tax=Prauserella marina TaxID=530584 RepID=A0A1G6NK34_9PSEU|nr:DNA processing protein [Prauserella marina]SDC67657.1 DNA processing protein [Prauserella marina]